MHNPEFETFFKESLTNSNTITPIMIDIESKVGMLEPKTNYSKRLAEEGKYKVIDSKNIKSLKLEEMNETDRLKYIYAILCSNMDISNKHSKPYLISFYEEIKYLKSLNKK